MSEANKLTYGIASIGHCNFWSIPKCGNTTIKYRLLQEFKPGSLQENDSFDRWVHRSDLMEYITPKEALNSDKYNFTFIRDPVVRFLSLYKDFCCTRSDIPEIFGISPEQLLDKLREYVGRETSANIHLRSISYFLDKFRGDVFLIDDFEGLKLNRRDRSISVSPSTLTQVRDLWVNDYRFYDMIRPIDEFKEKIRDGIDPSST